MDIISWRNGTPLKATLEENAGDVLLACHFMCSYRVTLVLKNYHNANGPLSSTTRVNRCDEAISCRQILEDADNPLIHLLKR